MPTSKMTLISVDDMLLEWALAEMDEWRRVSPDLEALGQELAAKTTRGEALDERDRAAAITAFGRIERRGPEVVFFRGQGSEWYRAEFAIVALGEVRLHRHWALEHWRKIPGAAQPYPRTVAEFSRRADRPSDFDRQAPHPVDGRRPIFVATGLAGPWHIAEGSHRSHSVWTAYERGSPDHQDNMLVVVGVHPKIDEWWNYLP